MHNVPFSTTPGAAKYRVAAILACFLALACMGAAAQGYPVEPVRVLVGFPPGAGVDITTRLILRDGYGVTDAA